MPRDPYKLGVFNRAHDLALDIYRLTRLLPEDERYGLSAELRRAGLSVPTNLVEGSARVTGREYQRFVGIALGSATEVRYLLGVAVDLGDLKPDDVASCRECSDHVVRELQNPLKAVSRFPS
jgi:four helix bundle protein